MTTEFGVPNFPRSIFEGICFSCSCFLSSTCHFSLPRDRPPRDMPHNHKLSSGWCVSLFLSLRLLSFFYIHRIVLIKFCLLIVQGFCVGVGVLNHRGITDSRGKLRRCVSGNRGVRTLSERTPATSTMMIALLLVRFLW